MGMCPWIDPESYYEGFNGKQLLVLGESFYCDIGCSKNDCDNNVACHGNMVKEFQKRSLGNNKYQATYTNIANLRNIISPEDAQKHARPDWIEVMDGKIWEENDRVYVVQLNTPKLSTIKRGITEDDARGVNKSDALTTLAKYASGWVDTFGASSIDRIDTDKTKGKIKHKEIKKNSELKTNINTTTQHLMSALKVEKYYGEEWLNTKNITDWNVWETYSVPKTVIETARNKLVEDEKKMKEAQEKGAKEVQDLIAKQQNECRQSERNSFSEIEKKYETSVTTLEDDLNSSFPTQYPSRYNFDFNEIIATEVNLTRLTSFIQKEESVQNAENKSEYEKLLNRIRDDKKNTILATYKD
jgi:hypothetical protein